MFPEKLKPSLAVVEKPGRYTGGELNSIVKDKAKTTVSYALCFPDTYEIGMSHLGMKILYSLVNERENYRCERSFAPWPDMEKEMRDKGVKLYALESGDALDTFDVIGFTMQYEMSYTNLLNMLSLAGIPLRSAQRTSLTPLIIAGGPCVCNAEPIADFVDITLPGEGEEVTIELLELLEKHKALGSSKEEFLIAASRIKGVYVPSLYDVSYNEDNTVKAVESLKGAPARVEKRIVSDLDSMFSPEKFIVPFVEVVHDRTTVEIFRGCIRGCRFCQAGFLYRPIREKSPEVVEEQCRKICDSSGYDEISLCSLSTSDYRGLEELIRNMLPWTMEQKINISLPSLRADNFPRDLMEQLYAVRRSGLTFAPEAGTQRLRDVINKNVTEKDVLDTAKQAFGGGWTAIKLYFMIGLPTETYDDIAGIAALAGKVVDEYYHNPNKPKGKSVSVSLSVASLVPKPFTPFQWERQDKPDELIEKQKHLVSSITTRKVSASCHKPFISFLEGVFARGDRRLSAVIEAAWKKGCRLDGWEEFFSYEKWMEAFEDCGIDPFFYTARERSYDEIFPWDHMDYGVSKQFLINENKKAHEGVTTASCREKCAGCTANRLNGGVCNEMRKNMV